MTPLLSTIVLMGIAFGMLFGDVRHGITAFVVGVVFFSGVLMVVKAIKEKADG